MDILQTKEKSEKLSQNSLEYYVLQMIEKGYSDSTKPEVQPVLLSSRVRLLCRYLPKKTSR